MGELKVVIYTHQGDERLQSVISIAKLFVTLHKLNIVPLRKHYIYDGVRFFLEPC